MSQMSAVQNEGRGSKRKYDDSCKFEIPDHCDDEVELRFQGSQSLYVSKNFLGYASPVFKAMFEHDCKEKRDGCVNIADLNKDNFLEFLFCLDPSEQKKVDASNYLKIAEVAEKYQVIPLIEKCKKRMKKELEKITVLCTERFCVYSKAAYATEYIQILKEAEKLNYKDISRNAWMSLSQFPVDIFVGPVWSSVGGKPSANQIAEQKMCINTFKTLNAELRFRIVLYRLLRLEKPTQQRSR